MLQFEIDKKSPQSEKKVHFAPPIYHSNMLESYGLTDDCPLPTNPMLRHDLWKYCQLTAGSSLFAAHLLTQKNTNDSNAEFDVAIHWGGGRHHAQPAQANGFCYINDVVLAIQHLIQTPASTTSDTSNSQRRVLYIDIDIHHGDGVQDAFYTTNKVLTCSFHRYTKSFFPYPKGSTNEKGRDEGLGYNVNIPLPKHCTDHDFFSSFEDAVNELVSAYEPSHVVMCVGADGLKEDPLIKGMGDEGWKLSPKGIANCVKWLAGLCSKVGIKILLLGGGGYNDTRTALTYLLCTAGACEGSNPGLLDMLPRDVPKHEFFCRYGPSFELISSDEEEYSFMKCYEEYKKVMKDGKRAVYLASHYIRGKRTEKNTTTELRCYSVISDEDELESEFWSEKYLHKKRKRKTKVNKFSSKVNS